MLIETTKSIQKPIFHDNDGSIDDFVALINILSLNQYRLTGISITNGNCYSDIAVESVGRILDLFCRHDVEISVSDETTSNPFPDNWREKNSFVNSLDLLNHTAARPNLSTKEAADFTAEKLLCEEEKTTIVLTGPASNLAKTFAKYPEAISKVDKILWMAGAFLADGNVKAPDHDGSAEWNIFWSPEAATHLLQTGIPIFIFPLDVCRQLPVDNYIMYHLKNSESKVSQLVYELFNPIYTGHSQYYMWDVLPTVFLDKPELFTFENTAINVELRGTSRGNIYRSSKGNRIKYAKSVDDEGFYDYLIEQFQQF